MTDQVFEYDVFVQGTVFLDIVLTGLPSAPATGTEIFAEGMGSCPGGVANFAIAASRLGLRSGLAAVFGDDVYADFCWRTLAEQEKVDLSHSRRIGHWHSPVTVSMSIDRDRAMVTHAHDAPGDPSKLVGPGLRTKTAIVPVTEEQPEWTVEARRSGALLFGDVGWDPTDTWSPAVLDVLDGFHAFTPNAVEAMAYTRTDSAEAALRKLADRVPLAVVTNGSDGVMAIDSSTGEEAQVPALPVRQYDPTGAGDVFLASLVLGTLREWPLAHRLAFGNLCAGLSVQHFGGSLAAPGWGDIIDWVRDHSRSRPGDVDPAILRQYAFIGDVLPEGPVPIVRRAGATIARLSDA
ncbi:carbohydrate kinase family protein [Kribbella deserti]|uniref:Carbohydrate kinase family protein n=1 Tax=Kribbella deserti TaxID=1926257 RepID=A0ABV6QPJ8_9ACTN